MGSTEGTHDLAALAWDRLRAVRALGSRTSGTQPPGCAGEGVGTVAVDAPAADTLIFRETGRWFPAERAGLRFVNVYRWRRTRDGLGIGLAHLRQGGGRPVALVEFRIARPAALRARTPHWCAPDHYDAELRLANDALVLRWWVRGPSKDYRIETRYTSSAEAVEVGPRGSR